MLWFCIVSLPAAVLAKSGTRFGSSRPLYSHMRKYYFAPKKQNCSYRTEYRVLHKSSGPPLSRCLSFHVSLINALPAGAERHCKDATFFFFARMRGCTNCCFAALKHGVRWRRTNPPSGPQSVLPSLHLLLLRCPFAGTSVPLHAGDGPTVLWCFLRSGTQCVFVFASLCSISQFSPSQLNRYLLSLPSLSWLLRSHSALCVLPLASLLVSFHHYLCFLRGTSSYRHYFPLPPSIYPPPFMSSTSPVSLCDEYAACCCQVERNFGMVGTPLRLQPGFLSLPQRHSGFTDSCRREMRATLSSCALRSLVLASTPDIQLLTGQPQPTCSRPSVHLSRTSQSLVALVGNQVCVAFEPLETQREVDWSDFEPGESWFWLAGLILHKLLQIDRNWRAFPESSSRAERGDRQLKPPLLATWICRRWTEQSGRRAHLSFWGMRIYYWCTKLPTPHNRRHRLIYIAFR